MLPDLRKELENSIVGRRPAGIDCAAVRKGGKIFIRNRELADFSCFDILGLSQNRKVRRRAQETIESLGLASCASRKSGGTSDAHLTCEMALAKFFGYEKSLLFSGRNQAIVTMLATLLREQDQIVCDEDCAGLLGDVGVLLNCGVESVALSSLEQVDSLLGGQKCAGRRFVYADSVAITSGRKLDLPALCSICGRHNASLLIDESYAAGLLGKRGAGVADDDGVAVSPARPLALVSELGLGLGGFGACVCGEGLLIDAIALRSRTLGVEPGLPPHLAASMIAAIDICELSVAKRALAGGTVQHIASSLSKIKQCYAVAASGFVSLRFDKERIGAEFVEHLFGSGFFVDMLPSPSKFSEAVFVRIVPNSFHDEETIGKLMAAIETFFAT